VAWEYTPRQIAGWCQFAHYRRQREMAEQLSINALAAQGDGKAISDQLKAWS
jgi:hypothetical protein